MIRSVIKKRLNSTNGLVTSLLKSSPACVHGSTCIRPYSDLRKYPEEYQIDNKNYKSDDWTNTPSYILELTERKLHQNPNHPVGILVDLIERSFEGMNYTFYKDFKPIVTTVENFDMLMFPDDHPGRSKSDTYYLNKDYVLRTHASAHEYECFQTCPTSGYFIAADVYRKDEVDRTHYPAFHQLEGSKLWSLDHPSIEKIVAEDIEAIPKSNITVDDPFRDKPYNDKNPRQPYMSSEVTRLLSIHLKKTIEHLVNQVFEAAKQSAKEAGADDPYFNEPLKARWVEAYFPWTSPSWEIEVWWKGEWLECCGCGLVQQPLLLNAGLGDKKAGWAFGIGLDRIAMLLFGIPDIRLFWTLDERFAKQFQKGKITTFKPYSKFPGIKRDVSFWLPDGVPLHVNDVMETVRIHANDLVENVQMIDDFVHPKNGRRSNCYRINYQSMDRNLTNSEINEVQENVQKDLANNFKVEIR